MVQQAVLDFQNTFQKFKKRYRLNNFRRMVKWRQKYTKTIEKFRLKGLAEEEAKRRWFAEQVNQCVQEFADSCIPFTRVKLPTTESRLLTWMNNFEQSEVIRYFEMIVKSLVHLIFFFHLVFFIRGFLR